MGSEQLATRALAVAGAVVAFALAGCGAEAGTPSAGHSTPMPQPTPIEGAMVAPAGGDLPDRVSVTCGPEAPVVSTEAVRASRDGVMVAVTGRAGWILGVAWAENGDIEAAIRQMAGMDTNMTRLERDQDVIAVRVPPGVVSVTCVDPARVDGPWEDVLLRIEDPEGWFRPTMTDESLLDCVSREPAGTSRGVQVPPVAQARALLTDVQPGDAVERGGWPADTGTVRVVRQGRVIGRLVFVEDDTGGWRLFFASVCGGLGLRPG